MRACTSGLIGSSVLITLVFPAIGAVYLEHDPESGNRFSEKITRRRERALARDARTTITGSVSGPARRGAAPRPHAIARCRRRYAMRSRSDRETPPAACARWL